MVVELNKIYCEDCIDFLNKLDDNSLDCIITSPPYNFGKDYNEYNDNVDFKVYEEWLTSIFELCAKKLKDGGRMFVNVQPVFSENFPTHHIVSSILHKCGLTWGGEILWEKNNLFSL